MKLLYLLPQIYPYYTGGAEIFHYHLLKEIAQSESAAYIGYDDIKEKNITFYKLYRVRPWRLTIPFQTIILLLKLRKKYDIVHLNYCQGSWIHWFYFPILKKYFGFKYGLTIHDPSLFEWKQKKIFKKVFDEAQFIVAVSERLKSGYEERCNRHIEYLPPLIPLKKYMENTKSVYEDLGVDEDSRIILFAGSLKDSKRPFLLAKSLLDLDKHWLDSHKVCVLYAGDGDQREELINFIINNDLKKYFKLLGRIPQESLAKYYRIASLYVIPSIHEGKSMSLIEAMFNRLPIIASNAPGINDIILDNKNGLLFEIDDYEELALCIKNLIEDRHFAMKLAQKAYSDYESQFRFEDMYNHYLSLYS